MKYDSLVVGQVVGVAEYYGFYHSVHLQGLYTVVKKNKMKVVIQRNGDGYERTFSIKTDREIKEYKTTRTAEIVSEGEYKLMELRRERELNTTKAWADIQKAASHKDIAALKAAMIELESTNTEVV